MKREHNHAAVIDEFDNSYLCIVIGTWKKEEPHAGQHGSVESALRCSTPRSKDLCIGAA